MHYTVLIDTNNPAGAQLAREKINELVQNGTIIATTQVWHTIEGRWIDAQAHGELSGLFADSLWDAWEQASEQSLSLTADEYVENDTPDSGIAEQNDEQIESVNGVQSSQIDALPEKKEHDIFDSQRPFEKIHMHTEVVMQSPVISLKEEPVLALHQPPALEEEVGIAITPSEELPMLSELSLIPLDEVSPSYPQEAALPLPLVIPQDIPRRSRPLVIDKPKGFSFVRVAVPIVLGSLCILGGLDYLRSLNERAYIPPPAPQLVTTSSQSIWSIESDIRNAVGEDIIPLTPDSSFEDILHVELQRTGITSIQIRASVMEWTGRKQDQPKKIDVRIRAESTGELDRDIGTISLILAKYIEFYFLDVERFEVCVSPAKESYLCSALNPEVIRRFYLKRIDHEIFFSDVFSVP